jgi:hypothetical protein
MRFCLLLAAALTLTAQEPSPSLIQIYREQVKPGKMAPFLDVEQRGATMCAQLHCPNPYLAIVSVTGADEAWWINGFESADAMEKMWAAYGANPEIMKKLDEIAVEKTDMAFPHEVWLARFRPDLSAAADASFAYAHYLSISIQRVRPGQLAAYEKNRRRPNPAHSVWIYQVLSGPADNTFVVIFAGRTVKDVLDPAERQASAAGDLLQMDLESSVTRLFAISPALSLPSQSWVEADPEFWKRP